MSEILKYKEKPLVRRGNMIYYGDPSEKYIILFIVNATKNIEGLEISTNVTIQLLENSPGRDGIIKQAERDGMYTAMDIAEYWLQDAIQRG